MKRQLRVGPEAEAEIISAAEWYESKRPALGLDFMVTLDRSFEEVLDAPEANPLWDPRYPFRKYVVRRFPFVVFFKVSADAVEVVAVAHAKRQPGYWLGR